MVRQPTASRFLSTLSLRRATDEAYFTRKAKPYFYPRSPCGERLIRYRIKARYTNFYPRSPCGERRYLINTYHRIFGISIHALLAESDAVTRVASTPTTVISIHALLAESDQQDKHHPHHGRISIHALLAESDPAEQHANSQQEKFLSTLSLRRATGQGANTRQKQQISIHALLAESDVSITITITCTVSFLSTLSLRRATAKVHKTVGHFCAYGTNFMGIASSC